MNATAIKHGRMTDAERDEIERLASTMKNPTPGKIARRLNRKVSTVNWYMLTHGLIERKIVYRETTYQRRGYTVAYYSQAADLRILELRRDNKNPREIAEIISGEFVRQRTGHSVKVRLVMLASYVDAPEGEAA
jgi:DNA-binding CsgD family transcriptional regulator